MKSMNDDTNNNNNNWLGFSLSPHMKMEVNSSTAAATPNHHHHQYHDQSEASSVYMSSHHLNTSAICYGVGENGAFHSPLSVMPLKSDGSLCIMEALSRSQQQQHEGLLLLLNFSTSCSVIYSVCIYLLQEWWPLHLQSWRTSWEEQQWRLIIINMAVSMIGNQWLLA